MSLKYEPASEPLHISVSGIVEMRLGGTKRLQERGNGSKNGVEILSLEKAPVLDPFFGDLARAKSAKELKEHLGTRVL